MSVHLVIPDPHAHFQHDNSRADLLGKLINDLRPDVVINLGDSADMPSLASYDRGLRSFQGKTYRADVNAHLDFDNRIWEPVRRRKQKLPRRVFLEGNHEHRIEKALDLSPELVGTISFKDLDLEKNYDDIVRYEGRNTPGTINIDGIVYAHYLVSGVKGLPISGEHTAYTLLVKQFQSCTVGHNHTLDYCIRNKATGGAIQGLCAGVFQEHDADWAGEINKLWWRGVIIKRNVEDGMYDPQMISLAALRKAYEGK